MLNFKMWEIGGIFGFILLVPDGLWRESGYFLEI